jgi:hypothetical protein
MSSKYETHSVEELLSSLDWRMIDANEASLIRSLAVAQLVSEPDYERWEYEDVADSLRSDPFGLGLEEVRTLSSDDVSSYMAFLVRYMALAYKGTVLWVSDRNHNPPGTPAHVLASLRALTP